VELQSTHTADIKLSSLQEGPAKRMESWIVIEAKKRRPKVKTFRQETGWRKPNYAGVSVI
jgi:hypothetical protein